MNSDIQEEALYEFERAQAALSTAVLALREVREALGSAVVPMEFCQALIPLLKDIEGTVQPVSPREVAYPHPYRDGLLCVIDGVGYWHGGGQYWLAVGARSGPEMNLRDLPGFKDLQDQYEAYASVLYGREWQAAGECDHRIAEALSLLRVRNERLWWDSVVQFLREYKSHRVDRELARRTLLDGGFDAAKVDILLPK